jgi:predicted PurR-regulated permease PerM
MGQNQGCSVSGQPSSQRIFRYFLVIFLITIFLVGKILWPFLSILILALVMTAIFYPLYGFFVRKIPPVLSSIATCFVIFLVVFLPLVFMIGALSKEAYNLYLMATNPTTNQYLKELFQNSQLIGQTQEFFAKYSITLSTEDLNKGLSGRSLPTP